MRKGLAAPVASFMLLAAVFFVILFVSVKPTAFITEGAPLTAIACGDTITSDTTLTGDLGPCSGGGITIGADDIVLDCGSHTITGTGSGSGNGVYVSSTNITIKNCIITNFDYGITLDFGSYNTLTNNTVNSNKQYGISLHETVHNILTDNTVNNNNQRLGIRIEADSYNNTLTNNTAKNQSTGIYLSGAYGNTIANNTIKDNSNDIGVSATTDVYCNNLIENNTGSGDRPVKYANYTISLDSQTFSQLILCNADYSNISNVIINGSATTPNNGLSMSRTDNASITNLNSYSIYLTRSYNNTLTNNTAKITLFSSSNNILTGNTASNTTGTTYLYGISLQSSSNYNALTNNTVNNNRLNGIELETGSLHNILTGNTACNAERYDIHLSSDSNDNTGTDNICTIKRDDDANTGLASCMPGCPPPVFPITGCRQLIKEGGTYILQNDISSSSCFTFSANNITLDCNSHTITGLGGGTGIKVQERNNITIKNCIVNNFSDGIFLMVSSYDNITNNTVSLNNNGIFTLGSSDNKITNNTFCSNIDKDIYLDEISNRNTGDNYCDNKQDDDGNPLACSACPVPPSPPQNVTDCQIISSSGTYIIQNNITSVSSDPCLTITANDVTLDCDGFSITGGYTTNTGVFISNSTDVTVENCVLSQFAFGIFLGMSSENNITNNTITNSFQGVYLNGFQDPDTLDVYTSDNNTISGNRFDSNQESAFIFFGNGNNITDNNVTNAGSDPNVLIGYPPDGYTEVDMSGSIAIMVPSFGPNLNSNNTISGNNVINGLNDGLDLAGAINTTVIDNIFDYNSVGMYIYSSCDSLTVINNTANNNVRGISSSSSGVFINNTANNNSQYGIEASGTLINNTANNNGLNGFNGGGDVENNTFCSNGERDIWTGDNSIRENNTCDSLLYWVTYPATYTSLPCSAACPRTPITDCQAINQSGVFYLANDISGSGDCLDVQAGNVKLDCEGHSITGPGSAGNGIKTVFASRKRYVDITNCTITGWNNGISVGNAVWYNILNSNISSNQYGVSVSGFTFEIHANNNSIYNNTYRNIQKGGTIFYNFSSNYFGTADCPDETKLSEMSYPYDINPYLDAPRGTETVCDRSVKATVLFAPYYNSTAPYDVEDTNFSITNTGDLNVTLLVSAVSTNVSGTYPHNRYVELRFGETTSILASDIDPDGTGYLMTLPLNPGTGEAFAYNYLTGKVEFNRTAGHSGTYYMLGFRAIGSTVGIINGYGGAKGKLQFDGTHLEQMPIRLTTPEYPPSSDNNSARFIVASPVNDLTRSGHDWDFVRSTTLQFLVFNSPYEQRFSTSRTLDTFWDTETCLIDTTQCARSIFNSDVAGTPLLTFITTSLSLPVAGLMMTYDNNTGFAETNTLYSYSSFVPIEIKYPLNATPTDPTPPTTTATATNYIGGGYYTSVILNCTDNLSGCEKINWQILGQTTGTYSCAATPCVTTIDLPSGPSTLNFYSEDRAWNVETTKTQNFFVNTITSDMNLTGDLSASSGYALIIGADDITLNCAGHSITGTGADVGVLVSNHTNVTIKNCVVSNFSFAIFLGMSSDCNVTNNTVDDNWQGIYLAPLQNPDTSEVYTSDNNTIEGNMFDSNNEGISVRAGSYNNMTNNNITNTGSNPDVPYPNNDPVDPGTGWQYIEIDTGAGISMMLQMDLSCNNNIIDNNRVINGAMDGLIVVGSTSNTFSNNVFVNNGNNGINLQSSPGDTLTNNAACHNANQDIYLDGSSTGNTGDNTCNALQDDTGEGTVTCNTPCPVCGNELTEMYEVCDGTDLVGQTCQSLGYNLDGTLACAADCLSFDESDCRSDLTPPTITVLIPPSPANSSVQASRTLELHSNVTDSLSNIDTCVLELDGVNETMNKIGTGTSVQCKATKTLLDRTTHNFTVYANDSLGNMGVNGTWSFSIQLPRPSAPSAPTTGDLPPAKPGKVAPPEVSAVVTAPTIWPDVVPTPTSGTIAIPPQGVSLLLKGSVKDGRPTGGTVAILIIPRHTSANVHNITEIVPQQMATLPAGLQSLSAHEINISSDSEIEYCMDYTGALGNISESTLDVWQLKEGSWMTMPSEKVVRDTEIICGIIDSAATPYMIAGFVTAPIVPATSAQPAPGPTDVFTAIIVIIVAMGVLYIAFRGTAIRRRVRPKR